MNKALTAALALALINFGSTAAWAKGGGGRASASPARSAPSYSRPAPARPAPAKPARSAKPEPAHSSASPSNTGWPFYGYPNRSGESPYCLDGKLKDFSKPKGFECIR